MYTSLAFRSDSVATFDWSSREYCLWHICRNRVRKADEKGVGERGVKGAMGEEDEEDEEEPPPSAATSRTTLASGGRGGRPPLPPPTDDDEGGRDIGGGLDIVVSGTWTPPPPPLPPFMLVVTGCGESKGEDEVDDGSDADIDAAKAEEGMLERDVKR